MALLEISELTRYISQTDRFMKVIFFIALKLY